MAICDCKAETSRTITHLEGRDGKRLPAPITVCPSCHPGEFESVVDPSDKKLWPNWIANPEEYDTLVYEDGERVPKIKDWAKGEFEQLVMDGPVAKAEESNGVEARRAWAREHNKRGPLTKSEVEFRVNYFRRQFEEAERAASAEAAGLIIP